MLIYLLIHFVNQLTKTFLRGVIEENILIQKNTTRMIINKLIIFILNKNIY